MSIRLLRLGSPFDDERFIEQFSSLSINNQLRVMRTMSSMIENNSDSPGDIDAQLVGTDSNQPLQLKEPIILGVQKKADPRHELVTKSLRSAIQLAWNREQRIDDVEGYGYFIRVK